MAHQTPGDAACYRRDEDFSGFGRSGTDASDEGDSLRFDIHLQGDAKTAFFEL